MTQPDPAFDALAWHDCTIYSLRLIVGDPEENDWTSDLALDIDYIAEWLGAEPGRCSTGMRFRVAPATLVFHGVTDANVDLRSRPGSFQIALEPPVIDRVERARLSAAEQRVFLDRPYYRWQIVLAGPPGGGIAFGAVGFTQTLQAEPVVVDTQRLRRAVRDRLWRGL